MRALVAIAALLLAAGPAAAGPSISLNGVPIDGAVGQRIDNATVVIDEQGNVNILAAGYAVARPGEAAALPASSPPPRPPPTARPPPVAEPRSAAAPGRPTRRYFAVVMQTEPGATQYDVALFVNDRWVREFRSDGDAEPFELTRFLQPGANRVQLVASKRVVGARRSTARDSTLRVVLGEGSAGGGHVLVDVPIVEMTRTAAETETVTEEHTLVAR